MGYILTPFGMAAISNWVDFSYMSLDEADKMVERISWFAKIDYPLLGFVEDHDILISPKVLAANIGYDRSYTGKRLRALRDAGLFEQHNNGLYELSDLGRQFLAGELSDEEIETLDPDVEG